MAEKLSDQLFSTLTHLGIVEERLMDLLEELGIPFDDFSYDGHDRSIEIKGCPNDYLMENSVAKHLLDKTGFARMWLNYLDGTEIYFNSDGEPSPRKRKAGTK